MSRLLSAVNPALALLTAALLVLVFPKWDQVWLAPFALIPLLVALGREPRPLRRFLLGWVSGFFYWFGVCYWIQGTLEIYGAMGVFGSWGTFVLFCVLKAIHLGLFGLLAAIVLPTWYAIPAVAALWTGIERTHGYFGFAWLCLGNAGSDMSVPMRLAPFVGVYGLSFLFALLSAAAAVVFLRHSRRELLWLAVGPALFLLPSLPAPRQPDQMSVLVQGNVSEDETWTPASAEEMQRQMISLSLRAALASHPSLIVWPETPGPIYYYRNAALRNLASDLVHATDAYLLFGTVAENAQSEPLNSAVMIAPDGHLIDRYDKINLVPFGEFVPKVFDFVNRVTKEAGDFAAGSRRVVFPLGSEKLGVFICYESVFPEEVRQFVKQGAGLLVNISNDGYFGHSAARLQHLKIVRMRAAENRRWILRATNDGVTASIDPAGRVRKVLPQFRGAASPFGFSYIHETTPYTLYGDWFAWSCLVLGCIALFFSQMPHYTPPVRPER